MMDTAKERLLEHLQNCQQPLPEAGIRGVYLLLREGNVVYVGQSKDCRRRIGSHLASANKDFDAFHIYPHPPSQDLGDLEAHLIYTFNPEYNTGRPANDHYVSVRKLANNYQGYGPHRTKSVLRKAGIEVRGGLAPRELAEKAMNKEVN